MTIAEMTPEEYDMEIRYRLRRRAWRKYGWIVCNPLTVLIAAHLVLAAIFALLGWEE